MRAALIPLLSWEKAAEKFSKDVEAILRDDSVLVANPG
jgi:hypothetical protein